MLYQYIFNYNEDAPDKILQIPDNTSNNEPFFVHERY